MGEVVTEAQYKAVYYRGNSRARGCRAAYRAIKLLCKAVAYLLESQVGASTLVLLHQRCTLVVIYREYGA